jgi:ubiquinone biosynthesis protein Coq4
MFEINAQMHSDLMKAAMGLYGLIQDARDLESVFEINDGLRNSEAMKASVDYLKSNPDMAQLMEERYIAPAPDMEYLSKLPTNTLGYSYASSLIAAGFDPKFYREITPADDIDYIRLRVRQTHDIWHIVTGFSTDEIGEIGLQSFGFSQMHYPSAVFILVASLIKGIKNPSALDPVMQIIYQGYELGKNAKPFLAFKWEQHWERELEDLRKEMNVQPVGQK